MNRRLRKNDQELADLKQELMNSSTDSEDDLASLMK